jgi:hypothetical protein
MQTRRDFVTWLSAMSLVGLARPLAADGMAEEDAETAARSWLDLVDGGQHARSWEDAAPAFKDAVSSEKWQRALGAVRQPLGSARSRRRLSRKLVDALPGAPKGPFVVIQFTTDFETKPGAVETITPALGADGRWRVSGYFIR